MTTAPQLPPDAGAEQPFVSVIIPVRDDEAGLALCLRRLEQQDYATDRYEVIVADNGSRVPPTSTVDAAPHARLVHEPRPGSYSARNAALAEARGEVIAFTDADCLPERDWLSRGVAAVTVDAATGLVAGRVLVVPADPTRPSALELFQMVHAFPQDRYVQEQRFGATANVITRRSVLDSVGLFDTSLASGGDKEWGKRVHAAGWAVVHAPDVVISHPARPSWREHGGKLRRVFTGELTARANRGEPLDAVGALGWRSLVPPVGSVVRHLGHPQLRGPRDRVLYALGATVARWQGTVAGQQARRAFLAGPEAERRRTTRRRTVVSTRLPGDWSGLVVICAGTFYNGHRLADQHLADQLADKGVPVLFVDPPVSLVGVRRDAVRAAAGRGPRLRLLRPGLARLTPMAPPGKTRPGIARLTDAVLRAQVVHATASLTADVRAVLTVGNRSILGATGERHRVFWARDDFAAGAELMGLNSERVRAQERRTAAAADLVLAVSPAIEEGWRTRGLRTAMVPNGCDTRHLVGARRTTRPADISLEGPLVGLVGTIGTRIELSLLEAVADRGHSLLLVGQRQKNLAPDRLAGLLARPNVQWVGHRGWDELPGYLGALSVGLVPYADSPFNRASFPLKTLEYLAAGLPVVSTSLPATLWLGTDLVTVADGADAFCDAVDRALASESSEDEVHRRQEFAARHDWAGRADTILSLLP